MHHFDLRVYYEDTDAGGVVYHARYLHFFERARTEYLRQLGFSQQALLAERQLAFVVKRLEIDYRQPARLDDTLVVQSAVSEIKGASLVFKQSLWRSDNCLSQATVVVVAVNLSKMKPMALPTEIRSAFILPSSDLDD
ncbi:tol-pal system-associated acyl-CoA thioesterase [Pasteurellaceae bacterium HPA106]|uniref:tol-pal system-associated acyl-CoA thioesterase n=1 Tax=Spirabiliibacterium pneumoniae TaxID=221400 RepID=UPI001AAD3AF6|nr:tol-pal system-associated acyl-CoA thioesterase [Spirabiliibacterium pneumoniae]MBE2896328.1 tol-pal system-associated acyl-CoA thioesterase [Spirabiliibacterium pneumoniae]